MDDFYKLVENSTYDLLFSSFPKVKCIYPKLDFEINPDKFIKWLKLEGNDITGDYKVDCGGMCEYAGLYILMLFNNKKLKGDIKLINGNFGFWDHYWISYTLEGQEYFIDLTLQQFLADVPKLAISKAQENPKGYRNFYYINPEKYLKDIQAFQFYTIP